MAKLSINVNKIALIRNSRGESRPNVVNFSKKCLDLGAAGITVHPRPDARHITYDDVFDLSHLVAAYPDREFNVEGYPSEDFVDLINRVKPHQVTLVPDPPEALTSSFGWDVKQHDTWLTRLCQTFSDMGVRTSLFLDPGFSDFDSLKKVNPDRVELYTYDYAKYFESSKASAIAPYVSVANKITSLGIALNAGHDLTYKNVPYLLEHIPHIEELSIGHAFVCDCIEFGLDTAFFLYEKCVNVQPI